MLVFNEELRFSLPFSFGLVLFLDHGNVWERYQDVSPSEIKSTVGAGLRYNYPDSAHCRFDVGVLSLTGKEMKVPQPSILHLDILF